MKHISFPSIDQYRSVIKHVNDRCAYHKVIEKPTLTFHGNVKLHGTNSSIVFSNDLDTVYAQSRERTITPEDDNAGFARFVNTNQDAFKGLLAYALFKYNTLGFVSQAQVKEAHTIVVYGEWCGRGVQGGVAVAQLDKMFVIFAIKMLSKGQYYENDELVDGDVGNWLTPSDVKLTSSPFKTIPRVFCIENFPTWNIKIDFNNPAAMQNQLGELTLAVEQECPVGKHFGVSGTGEGIVWTAIETSELVIKIDDLCFKVKGSKHSDTKVKTLVAVDIEKVNSIRECAELVGTPHRFEKSIAFLRASGVDDPFELKNIGAYLKWIDRDIEKEETDTVDGNGLTIKDVNKAVQQLAKKWFMQQALNE